MNNQNNNRVLWLAIFGLLLLNLGTLGWVIFDKKRDSRMMSPFIMERDLHFDKAQREKFTVFKDKHFAEVLPIRDSLKILKNEAMELVKADKFDKIALEKKVNEITDKIRRNELNTFSHFAEIRSICTPEQKEIFDNVILEGLKKMGDPMKGGRPPR